MSGPTYVLCDGAPPPRPAGGRRVPDAAVLRLTAGDAGADVNLHLGAFSDRQETALSPRHEDLLRLAAFVFAADQRVPRGGPSAQDYGDSWRRDFRLGVPVAEPDFWNQAAVRGRLASTLDFLTDERWDFRFTPRPPAPPHGRPRLTDFVVPEAGAEFEEVMLFSGGLDSLCGAVEEAVAGRRRVALVGHHSANTVLARQRALFDAVRSRVRDPGRRPQFVPLRLNLSGNRARESTQRSRSFVFAAAAAVVARQVGLSRVLFAENGVTSLNLPVCLQVLGGRASRTTHPKVLADYGALLSLVFGCDFAVENRFQWETKAEMFARLQAGGHADLAAATCSCVRVREYRLAHPHCGTCSQCVDRRLSALAAGLDAATDPAGGYESDVVTGARSGTDLTMLDRYVGAAREAARWATPVDLVARYPEALAAVRALPGPAGDAYRRVYELVTRHARGVVDALDRATREQSARVSRQDYPADSLLGIVVGRRREAPAARPAAGASPAGDELVADAVRFEARAAGVVCFLGNTRAFHLLAALVARPGEYLTHAQLGVAVWDDADTAPNAIQRTASNLRRVLLKAGLTSWAVDGSSRGHYRLHRAAVAA